MNGQGEVAFHANNLGHRFVQGEWLFRGLTLDLQPGRVYALTGPSGSGKSTLLAILAGWTAPTEGTYVLPADATVSWVFQNPHGVAGRTVADHVMLPILARRATPEIDVAQAAMIARELLCRFGLAHRADSEFRHLSGGEAQRLMLARGIAAEPDLLLVDEPTAQLDRVTAAAVNEAIASIAGMNTVVVVATHDQDTREACGASIELGNDVPGFQR